MFGSVRLSPSLLAALETILCYSVGGYELVAWLVLVLSVCYVGRPLCTYNCLAKTFTAAFSMCPSSTNKFGAAIITETVSRCLCDVVA